MNSLIAATPESANIATATTTTAGKTSECSVHVKAHMLVPSLFLIFF